MPASVALGTRPGEAPRNVFTYGILFRSEALLEWVVNGPPLGAA